MVLHRCNLSNSRTRYYMRVHVHEVRLYFITHYAFAFSRARYYTPVHMQKNWWYGCAWVIVHSFSYPVPHACISSQITVLSITPVHVQWNNKLLYHVLQHTIILCITYVFLQIIVPGITCWHMYVKIAISHIKRAILCIKHAILHIKHVI